MSRSDWRRSGICVLAVVSIFAGAGHADATIVLVCREQAGAARVEIDDNKVVFHGTESTDVYLPHCLAYFLPWRSSMTRKHKPTPRRQFASSRRISKREWYAAPPALRVRSIRASPCRAAPVCGLAWKRRYGMLESQRIHHRRHRAEVRVMLPQVSRIAAPKQEGQKRLLMHALKPSNPIFRQKTGPSC